MPDLLDRVRNEIRTRLTELRPAVDEHARLDAALRALDTDDAGLSAVSPSTAAARRRASPDARRPSAPRRAPRGANRKAVLRVVADRPGITAGELAAASGVQRRTLYSLLSALTKQQVLQRRELRGGQNGYSLRDDVTPAPRPPERAGGA